MITAYGYIQSVKKYEAYLDSDSIYSRQIGNGVNVLWQEYCMQYWNDSFWDTSGYAPSHISKTELNEYELDLFRHHPAFVEEFMMFKGYKLIKD